MISWKCIWMSEQLPRCNMTSSKGSFKANSFEMNEFPHQPLKKISNDFDRISLFFQTVSKSEAKSLLPTVQLDFSWTLEMSDWQNHRFARPSESLSISPTATLHHPETLWKVTLSKWINFQSINFLLPTAQLDFSWTLQMSDRENDWFTRPSESLSNFLNAMCTIWEFLHKIFFESH